MTPRYYTPEEVQNAIRLHDEEGLTWKEVAERTGRSAHHIKVTVRNYRAGKFHFTRLNGTRRTQEMVAAARAGESAKAIAKRFGTEHRHVLSKLAYYGVSVKTGGDPLPYNNKMVAAVVAGMSPGDVARKFRISLPRVLRLLVKHGLIDASSSETYVPPPVEDIKGLPAGSRSRRADYYRKRASILHLADLKRARHSRFDTELTIPSSDYSPTYLGIMATHVYRDEPLGLVSFAGISRRNW